MYFNRAVESDDKLVLRNLCQVFLFDALGNLSLTLLATGHRILVDSDYKWLRWFFFYI